jgi:PAS domain S-box-containing protein
MQILIAVALAIVYYGAARLGLGYASVGESISLVWPPTGIALAALAAFGLRFWPAVAVGAFLANAATPIPLAAAAGIAIGNALEALVGAGILRRAAGGARPDFESMPTVRTLVLTAAPLGALVSAGFGVSALALTGALPPGTALSAGAVWWTGDVLGALVVAPVLLVWLVSRRRPGTRGVLEIALLCLGTAAASELALGRLVDLPLLRGLDYLYLLFPFVVWAALRFGSRGASLMTLTISIVAVWRTVAGGGPFAGDSLGATLFAAACYLGVVAVTGLILAAAVSGERATATITLGQREEQLREALDAARMGTWSWSAAEDRVVWDDALRRLYDLAPGEEVTTYAQYRARVHPEDLPSVEAAVRRAMEQGGRLDFEFRIRLADGRIRWIENQGRVVRSPTGAAIGLTGVSSDVTERHQAEEQLRQAHRMESVGRLAGGVAHETNNQMSVVIAASDFILKRGDVPTAVRADVESIRRAAERTAAVTAQLLAFSRRQVLNPQVLELNALLRRFQPVLERIMGEDCTVALRLAPSLDPVKADPGQLEQVLVNLALNARDAMPRGGTLAVETFVATLDESAPVAARGVKVIPGRYAVLAVSDTGHGMDRETLAHAFEPFFTTKGVGRGTGLGLSTVYGIVKQSDGYVWAYSEPDQGTTFRVYLPMTSDRPAAPGDGAATPPRASGELVMVVEDEASVRQVAARALADAGYQVLEAEGGSQALQLAASTTHRLALLLTDVVMPGMGGRELAGKMAELRPGTPVLYTSGYTHGEILRRGLLDPEVAFVAKPFTAEALVRAVRQRIEDGGPPA